MAALADTRATACRSSWPAPCRTPSLAATDGELTLDFRYYTLPVRGRRPGRRLPRAGLARRRCSSPTGTATSPAWRPPTAIPAWCSPSRCGRAVPPRPSCDASPTPGSRRTTSRTSRPAPRFAARPELRAQTWSLAYLRAVALAAGVLGLVGVAMHALAQQRRRTVGRPAARPHGHERPVGRRARPAWRSGCWPGWPRWSRSRWRCRRRRWCCGCSTPCRRCSPIRCSPCPGAASARGRRASSLVTLAGAVLVGRAARRATGGQVMRDAS